MKNTVLTFVTILFFASACSNDAYYEQNNSITNRSWEYNNKISFPVHIDDSKAKYDVYVNLRHSADYNYANIYFLLHQNGPHLLDTAYRKEITLAQLDGRWLGKSAGNLYETQYLAHQNFMFPDTGIYTFSLEQNMRENPLKDISDVGIKLVKK